MQFNKYERLYNLLWRLLTRKIDLKNMSANRNVSLSGSVDDSV